MGKLLSSIPPPDLIIIDQRLNQVQDGEYKSGSTTAEAIREGWPERPIVCVTAIPLSSTSFDFHQRSIFDYVIADAHLSECDSTLLSIIKGFQVLRDRRPGTVEDLLRLLSVPKIDQKRMVNVLPDNLKKVVAYAEKSLSKTVSDWVRNTLVSRHISNVG